MILVEPYATHPRMTRDEAASAEGSRKQRQKLGAVAGGVGGVLLLFTKACPTLCDPRTVGGQAPWSIGFPRQKYWSGLPFFSQGIFPTQGLNPGLLRCRQILYHPSYQRNQTGKGAMETEEQEGMSKKPMKAP